MAVEQGLPLAQPPTLKSAEIAGTLARRAGTSSMVVAAYGLILPQPVLDLFPLGCINIHASLLPRWRGAAPIQRAILAGDRDTGISIMRMEAGLDTGPVYSAERLPIEPEDTAGSLHDKLAVLGARCVVRSAGRPRDRGDSSRCPSRRDGVTYARKIEKHGGVDRLVACAQRDRSPSARVQSVPGGEHDAARRSLCASGARGRCNRAQARPAR